MSEIMTTQPSKHRKGGRPRLLPEERRSYQFSIGYTQAQYDQLVERAQAAGLSEVELIRRLSLNLEIKTIPIANREAVIELNRIGNNVNQIAHQLNAGAVEGLSAELIQRWLDGVNQALVTAGKRLVQHDQ